MMATVTWLLALSAMLALGAAAPVDKASSLLNDEKRVDKPPEVLMLEQEAEKKKEEEQTLTKKSVSDKDWSEDGLKKAVMKVLKELEFPTGVKTQDSRRLHQTRGQCGGQFSAPEGEFTSPNYPENYDINLSCTWSITAPDDNSRVLVTIDDFKTERSYDVVKFLDGDSTSAPVLKRVDGAPGDDLSTITSSGPSLTVTFTSDDSVTEKGFSMSYQVISCGGHVTDPSVPIASPGHGVLDSYISNMDCEWVIQVSQRATVRLTFQQFQLEGPYCAYDWLEVRDGSQPSSDLIGERSCGDSLAGQTLQSSNNALYLHFHSDQSVVAPGFLATFEEISEETPTEEVGNPAPPEPTQAPPTPPEPTQAPPPAEPTTTQKSTTHAPEAPPSTQPEMASQNPPEDQCQVADGASYRGTVAETASGRACQRWDSQTPHNHINTPENRPQSGLVENFCRNPDSSERVWCYTTDPGVRWEYCSVPDCNGPTTPPVLPECPQYQYACGSGECTHQRYECDGTPDCQDGSDEARCFECDGNSRGVHSVMPYYWVCDGLVDCADGADEAGCEEPPTPPTVLAAHWSAWSAWGACSKDCEGTRNRTRECVTFDAGQECPEGPSVQHEMCGSPGPCTPEPESDCGTRKFEQGRVRIINGEDAVRGSWPWIAQFGVRRGQKPFCGGTLIDPEWVVTASHCFYDANAPPDNNRFSVLLGKHRLRQDPMEDGAQLVYPEEIILHEDYSPTTLDNDIALVKIPAVDVDSNDYINAACLEVPDLQSPQQFTDESTCFTQGWGVTENKTQADTLQEARVPLIPNCAEESSYRPSHLTVNMLCAGYINGGVDSCQGDSGGPLVCQEETSGRWQLVGITSWGSGCAKDGYPGVYTRVEKYIDWIKDIIAKNSG